MPRVLDGVAYLSQAEAAALRLTTRQLVRHWMLRGIRVGGRRVRLRVALVSGTRLYTTAADLAAFDAECLAAMGSDGLAGPRETPTAEARRAAAAKARVAALVGAAPARRRTRRDHTEGESS